MSKLAGECEVLRGELIAKQRECETLAAHDLEVIESGFTSMAVSQREALHRLWSELGRIELPRPEAAAEQAGAAGAGHGVASGHDQRVALAHVESGLLGRGRLLDRLEVAWPKFDELSAILLAMQPRYQQLLSLSEQPLEAEPTLISVKGVGDGLSVKGRPTHQRSGSSGYAPTKGHVAFSGAFSRQLASGSVRACRHA